VLTGTRGGVEEYCADCADGNDLSSCHRRSRKVFALVLVCFHLCTLQLIYLYNCYAAEVKATIAAFSQTKRWFVLEL
jgi:hypothetical protein